jgi:hypothetical protein
MTPIPPIPNDLANLYHSGGHCTEHQKQALIERIARQDTLLKATSHALRSYQYGNASTELAQSMADRIDQQLQPTQGVQGGER